MAQAQKSLIIIIELNYIKILDQASYSSAQTTRQARNERRENDKDCESDNTERYMEKTYSMKDTKRK